MNARRLITLTAWAGLALASTELTAQSQRDSSSSSSRRRERSRDEQPVEQQAPSTRPAAAGYTERYAILEQRNVFVKDRSRPSVRTTAPSSTQPTKRSAEESLVVRGIAMEDAGYRAYVEDLNTNATLRLSPGDKLGRGRVANIAFDAIAYEFEGKETWVAMGHDLTGKRSDATSSMASSTSSPTTLPANVDINDPTLTIEQRMKLRVQLQNQQRGR